MDAYFASWGGTGNKANSGTYSDPKWADAANGDFTISSGSSLEDAGRWLTQANGSGSSSTTLIVDDARFFWYSAIDSTGDQVAIGSSAITRTITAINYSTNTITITPAATWSDNDDVTLYKSFSDSSTVLLNGSAPDIGVSELASTDPTVTVTASGADGTASEDGTTGIYTIACNPTCLSVSVNFTMTGTATKDTDYTLSDSGSIVINADSDAVTLTPIHNDDLDNQETAIITIDAGVNYTVGSPSTATITITDIDKQTTGLGSGSQGGLSIY
jgi:hypothetical protein